MFVKSQTQRVDIAELTSGKEAVNRNYYTNHCSIDKQQIMPKPVF